ncbi:hypothetical protein P7L78_22090 [Tistrella bauzanensis]|uniref:hypothetical protein n=1 Tax=Tistrella TaxID=171436 RepID=UPI0031F61B03
MTDNVTAGPEGPRPGQWWGTVHGDLILVIGRDDGGVLDILRHDVDPPHFVVDRAYPHDLIRPYSVAADWYLRHAAPAEQPQDRICVGPAVPHPADGIDVEIPVVIAAYDDGHHSVFYSRADGGSFVRGDIYSELAGRCRLRDVIDTPCVTAATLHTVRVRIPYPDVTDGTVSAQVLP